eukprot:CAMPEP_0171163670 /NCGR_PEP_ID=MMETSP0790-20130122/5270_1 /TAXON_ID=2925 /ORGANISM="Alexandrium catenella, Strain OF101" /LENGTH=109 /DNA_ID=CAMNT_0011628397 /DNA_START=138 /DNA_END=463 /DNA_ORIENTATION=+
MDTSKFHPPGHERNSDNLFAGRATSKVRALSCPGVPRGKARDGRKSEDGATGKHSGLERSIPAGTPARVTPLQVAVPLLALSQKRPSSVTTGTAANVQQRFAQPPAPTG